MEEAKESTKSPGSRLDDLEKRYAELLVAHVMAEAKLLTLDQVVGHLMMTGQKPSPEQVSGFWANAGAQVGQKYPGIKVEQQVVAPRLYVPTNGVAHGLK